MPKTYTRKKLVCFSMIEWELLKYLAQGGAAQVIVRDSLRMFARAVPNFRVDEFERHLVKNVLPKMDERQRPVLRRQLKDLQRTLDPEFKRGEEIMLDDSIDSAAVFAKEVP